MFFSFAIVTKVNNVLMTNMKNTMAGNTFDSYVTFNNFDTMCDFDSTSEY